MFYARSVSSNFSVVAGERLFVARMGRIMRKATSLVALLFLLAFSAAAQEKGVDQQNERVRDNSVNRAPAVNGGKVDVGTGRGLDFGKGRTPTPPPVPNPYRFSSPNDVVLKAVTELMRDRKLILDDAASRPSTGVLLTQPYTFIKGAVVAPGALLQVAEVPSSDNRGWTRGRYTLTVEILPTDASTTQVSINAKIEGRSEGVTGAEWVTLRSTGAVEQEFLIILVQRLTGAPPPGYEPIEDPE